MFRMRFACEVQGNGRIAGGFDGMGSFPVGHDDLRTMYMGRHEHQWMNIFQSRILPNKLPYTLRISFLSSNPKHPTAHKMEAGTGDLDGIRRIDISKVVPSQEL